MRFLISLVLAGVLVGQTAEKMLEAARHKEVMAGDLKGAIAEYRKIAAKFAGRPEVAAQALVKMGQCQEKLGESEARRSYERVVKEYAGAGAYAAQARARLAAMGRTGGDGARARVVWDGATDYWGRVSDDGRYLSYVDWTTGDLAIRDLVKGESRRVTNYGGYEKSNGEVEATSISPDGKRIVFSWDSWAPGAKAKGAYELRIIRADGSGERTLWKAAPERFFEAYGWSADGKWVAVCVTEGRSGPARITLLSPETGEEKQVATASQGWKAGIAFSPDGKWLAYESRLASQARTRNAFLAPIAGTGETMVAENASIMGWTPGGEGVVFRRSEAGGDRLYLLPVANGGVAGEAKPIRIPAAANPESLGMTAAGQLFYGTNNVLWGARHARVDVEKGLTFDTLPPAAVSGIGNASNTGNLRFSPDGKFLASANSNRTIRIQAAAGGAERILTVPVKELRRFEWMPDGSALLASALETGDKIGLYRVDANTGAATYLIGLERGLVFTPAADGKSVFEFDPTDGLAQIEIATGAKRKILEADFGGRGFPNIRRSRDGERLLLLTNAFVGIFDIASGQLQRLHQRQGENRENLWNGDWSADGRHVIVLARPSIGNDKRREMWVFPASGGAARKISFSGADQGDFALSPDAGRAVMVTVEWHGQVWAVENFLPAK